MVLQMALGAIMSGTIGRRYSDAYCIYVVSLYVDTFPTKQFEKRLVPLSITLIRRKECV